MKFPLRWGKDGPALSDRREHVREQIEQLLYTDPGERVFRPEFGVGVRTLVFEPNDSALRELTKQRLVASLADALQGEVDPKSLQVSVRTEGEKLIIDVSYALATIGHTEKQEFVIGLAGGSDG